MIKKERSFTLIELMTAVIVIGILATIAVPQLIKSVEKSRQAEAIDILTRMYKGYKILVIDEIVNPNTGGYVNETSPTWVFNPDEANNNPDPFYSRSDRSWKQLGFQENPNYQYNNLYFSYDFLKSGETSLDRVGCAGTRPTPSGVVWGIAYRKLSNSRVTGTELFPVNFDKRIIIRMNDGSIVKSSDY